LWVINRIQNAKICNLLIGGKVEFTAVNESEYEINYVTTLKGTRGLKKEGLVIEMGVRLRSRTKD
jgi:hypothetical protein